MRDELLREESKTKTDQQKQKIEELNAKMQQLELQRKEREERDSQAEMLKAKHQQAAEAKKSEGNKNFLGNIKSFDVEDI